MIQLAEMSRLEVYTDISMHVFIWGFSSDPSCRDEILLLALAKHVHFRHATQLVNDFCGVFYSLARKSIALARYLTLLYSTNIKLSKKG